MLRGVLMSSILFGAFIVLACTPEATPEEKQKMCENFVALKGEGKIVTVSDAISVIKNEFDQKEKEIKQQQEAEIAALDKQHEQDLASVKSDKEKETMGKEMQAQKELINANYAEKLNRINPDRENAIQDVKYQADKIQDEYKSSVKKCLNDMALFGVNQDIAQCRAKAKTVDEFWKTCQ